MKINIPICIQKKLRFVAALDGEWPAEIKGATNSNSDLDADLVEIEMDQIGTVIKEAYYRFLSDFSMRPHQIAALALGPREYILLSLELQAAADIEDQKIDPKDFKFIGVPVFCSPFHGIQFLTTHCYSL